jgi:long-chain acyl-CoA synthetase
MHDYTLRSFLKQSFEKHPELDSLTQSDGVSYNYESLSKKVDEISIRLVQLGIKKGDKVALLSKNCTHWGVSYLATTFIGAVIVPILNDFSKKEIENILNHSESKALFISENLAYKLKDSELETVKTVIKVEDFSFVEKHTSHSELNSETDIEVKIDKEDLAAIIYTSGTTSASKGVMLSHKNLVANTIACNDVEPIDKTDRFLSLLPLPHTYECTMGLLLPLSRGASTYYMLGLPTLPNLKKSLQKIRPSYILSVPLIIEKIYKQSVQPAISSGVMKVLYKIPPFRLLISRMIGNKLKAFFGGKLKFFGIGGALLDYNVEKFLRRAKFPYAIGYGLTETSPLLAGCGVAITKFRSTGPVVKGMQLKLDNIDPKTKIGEVLAKGESLMMGYFKNPEITAQAITPDGWFKTGDMGYLDKSNYLYIKGRLKNVIIGATGENIYPEEIESIINSHKLVLESLVYELKGKLVARIHLNMEQVEKFYKQVKDSKDNYTKELSDYANVKMNEIHEFVNDNVNKISKLSEVIEQKNPFIKTPTHKIKKFLYTKDPKEVEEIERKEREKNEK